MVGVARYFALLALGGLAAACAAGGLGEAELDALDAKPRMVDASKSRSAAKKDAGKKSAPQAAVKTAAPEQGDGGPSTVAAISQPEVRAEPKSDAARRPASGVGIPAQSLFGNWRLGREGDTRTCRIILGGMLVGNAYAASGEADCPPAFSALQTWEILGDELVLRNQSRGIVGRLSPTGPYRFDGTGEGGAAVFLIR